MPFLTEVEMEFFEPMGSVALVWTLKCGQPLHFRLDGQPRFSDGDRMSVGLDIVCRSVFDWSTEAWLLPGRRMPTTPVP